MSQATISAKTAPLLKNTTSPFLLVINKNENLVATILACANTTQIPSAAVNGIGALKDPTIGFYDTTQKIYLTKTFSGIYEIVNLQGNITKLNDNYVTHLHVIFSDINFQTYGGHLVSAEIGVTAEITIIPFSYPITRALNPEFNLNLIQANHERN